MVNEKYIVIKADDFSLYKKGTFVGYRWDKFVYNTIVRDIKSSIGISGSEVHSGNITWIKCICTSGMIEFWHHGHIHCSSEFCGHTYLKQKELFHKCNEIFFAKTGIVFRTFGAPGNMDDVATAKVLGECKDIKVWFFKRSKANTDKVVLKNQIPIECGTGEVRLKYFYKHYKERDTNNNIFVLQVHPKDWKEDSFLAFEEILDFLIAEGWTFKLPMEMA